MCLMNPLNLLPLALLNLCWHLAASAAEVETDLSQVDDIFMKSVVL